VYNERVWGWRERGRGEGGAPAASSADNEKGGYSFAYCRAGCQIRGASRWEPAWVSARFHDNRKDETRGLRVFFVI